MREPIPFGPYTLLRRLPDSPRGRRFSALYDDSDEGRRLVSVEFLDASVVDQLDRSALIDAYRLASRLNHINLVQVLDVGSAGGDIFVVSELVDGVPLSTVVDALRAEGTGAAPEVAAFVAAELAAGLSYAHGRRDDDGTLLGVVHTALAPADVLVSSTGDVKIAGFGIARQLLAAGQGDVGDDLLQFVAPEVARNEGATPAADVFSVGAIAFALAAARPIYGGVAGDDLLARARRGYVPDVRDADDNVPEALAEIVNRALQGDLDKRYATAADMRGALAAWLRRSSPGFGRHRLKTWAQRLVPDLVKAPAEGEWKALHRKDFRCSDADSLFDSSASTFARLPRNDVSALLGVSEPPRASGAIAKVDAPASAGAASGPEVFASRLPFEAPPIAEPSVATPVAGMIPAPRRQSRAQPAAHGESSIEQINQDLATAVYDDSIDEDAQRSAVRALAAANRSSGFPWGGLLVVAAIVGAAFGGWYYVNHRDDGPAASAETSGSIFVTSRPQGASISVDGRDTGLTTPAPIRALPAGREVSIAVALQGFDAPAASTVTVQGGHQEMVEVDLQPAAHTVRVDSDPPGATVIFNGEAAATTPGSVGPFRVDYRQGVTLVVRLPGYLDEHVNVTWEPGRAESSSRVSLRPDPNFVLDAGVDGGADAGN